MTALNTAAALDENNNNNNNNDTNLSFASHLFATTTAANVSASAGATGPMSSTTSSPNSDYVQGNMFLSSPSLSPSPSQRVPPPPSVVTQPQPQVGQAQGQGQARPKQGTASSAPSISRRGRGASQLVLELEAYLFQPLPLVRRDLLEFLMQASASILEMQQHQQQQKSNFDRPAFGTLNQKQKQRQNQNLMMQLNSAAVFKLTITMGTNRHRNNNNTVSNTNTRTLVTPPLLPPPVTKNLSFSLMEIMELLAAVLNRAKIRTQKRSNVIKQRYGNRVEFARTVRQLQTRQMKVARAIIMVGSSSDEGGGGGKHPQPQQHYSLPTATAGWLRNRGMPDNPMALAPTHNIFCEVLRNGNGSSSIEGEADAEAGAGAGAGQKMSKQDIALKYGVTRKTVFNSCNRVLDELLYEMLSLRLAAAAARPSSYLATVAR